MSGDIVASVARAARATDEEHAATISTTRCPICDAGPGEQCVYGKFTLGPAHPHHFNGRAHTRRVRRYLDGQSAPQST